ncbi:hypothetical protein ACCS64_39655 [Rhizobium ruizarguesonis]
MATYTKKSTSAADAALLNLLEEKVLNLTPWEGAPPDIAQALDRLYDMTMRGGRQRLDVDDCTRKPFRQERR